MGLFANILASFLATVINCSVLLKRWELISTRRFIKGIEPSKAAASGRHYESAKFPSLQDINRTHPHRVNLAVDGDQPHEHHHEMDAFPPRRGNPPNVYPQSEDLRHQNHQHQ